MFFKQNVLLSLAMILSKVIILLYVFKIVSNLNIAKRFKLVPSTESLKKLAMP